MPPVILTPDDVLKCVQFGSTAFFLNSQSREQLGGGSFRDADRFVRDQVRGKLAEIALQRLLAAHGLDVDLDFEHNANPAQGDAGDLAALHLGGVKCRLALRCDVKSTGGDGGWLLVGRSRLNADVYVLVRMPDFPADGAPADLLGRSFTAEPVGWAEQDGFRDADGALWFDASRDGGLPDPAVLPPGPPPAGQRREEPAPGIVLAPAPEDSAGLPAAWLRNDWDALADRIASAVRVPDDADLEPASELGQALAAAAPKYSLLVGAGEAELQPADTLLLLRHLQRGVQIYLAAQVPPERRWFSRYIEAGLFQAFMPRARRPAGGGVRLVVDGVPEGGGEALPNELDGSFEPAWEDVLPFNAQQFAVEHAPPDEMLCIRAGAGTGKTTVMVGRVLFLLHVVEGLRPGSIAMITFTRDSAHTMRVRLRGRLLARYRATADQRYLRLLEELGGMSIRTIHSFSKDLLQTLGSIIGYGRGVAVTEFSLERRRILEQLIDEQLRGAANVRGILRVELYKFIKAAESFWAEFEKRGLGRAEIAAVDWGRAAAGSESIHDILSTLITRAEEALALHKARTNAVSKSDLVRTVDEIRGADVDLREYLPMPPQYLFIDEFQDTDDVQIRLAVWFHRSFGTRLFAVGDVKQSIYRFRGAASQAFDVLDSLLADAGTRTRTHRLTRSYRTGEDLLQGMQGWFAGWGGRGLLQYNPDYDQLEAALPGGEPPRVDQVDRRAVPAWVQAAAREAEQSTPDGQQAAFLVRTNAQALEVKDWCRQVGVPCQVVSGGTFYASPAVVDFLHLVRGLLFPEDPGARLDLQNSPYSAAAVHWSAVAGFEGRPGEILGLLQEHPPQPGWEEYERGLRLSPVLSVLRRIIQDASPVEHVYGTEYRRAAAQGHEPAAVEALALQSTREYAANLAKLGQVLRTQFASQSATLDAVRQFLEVKRATDRDEDEAEQSIAAEAARVVCRTVHKAKGQEYHTVILPATRQGFLPDRDEQLLLNHRGGGWEAGWRLASGQREYRNDLHARIRQVEDAEVRAEEARLLYVALTRAKQRLWIARTGRRENTWAEILGINNGGAQP